MTNALLIVDVQNDFTEGGALAVAGGDDVARGVSALLAGRGSETNGRYDLVIASRDWHEPTGDNGGHFAAEGSYPDYAGTWPPHCVQGTAGAEYDPLLDIDGIDVHVRKGMGIAAYSAFEGETTDGRSLAEVLAERGVDRLDLVGIATDYCVLRSGLDAVGLGIRVRLLSDLIAGVHPDTSVAAIKELAAAGVEVV